LAIFVEKRNYERVSLQLHDNKMIFFKHNSIDFNERMRNKPFFKIKSDLLNAIKILWSWKENKERKKWFLHEINNKKD
jgi:hypothetical protein